MALVAVKTEDGQPSILGVSRYYLDAATGCAEFALAVGDPWQGKGLGRHLMWRLIDVARDNGVQRLDGTVLRENAGMLQLVQKLGFTIRATDDAAVVEAGLDLA
jgi:acetyltransferase